MAYNSPDPDEWPPVASSSAAALWSTDQMFRAIVENIEVGVALISPKMEILWLNRQMREWFPKARIGERTLCYAQFNNPPRTEPCPYCPTIKTLRDGLVHEAITETPAGDRVINYRVLSSPISGPGGETLAAIEMVEDVTARRAAEKELHRLNEALRAHAAELERRNRQMALLGEMGGLLQACSTAEEAFAVFGQCAAKVFPQDSGALYVFRASRTVLEGLAAWGESSPKESVFRPEDCWALRMGRPYRVSEPGDGPRCPHAATAKAPSLCVPLMAQGEVLGLFHLLCGDSAMPEERRLLAASVCDQLALALGNLRMRETLQQLSIRDSLTGLYNRRYMEEMLEREFLRQERKGLPVAVLMFDLDRFKSFNDTFGHAAGDLVLREVGALLRRHIRGGDIACRYGGEEFVVVLPETPLEAAEQRAEEIRSAVRDLHVVQNGHTLGALTVSIGVAVFPTHGTTVEAVLKAADDALYAAKRAGRDRVCRAQAAPAPGGGASSEQPEAGRA